LTATATGFEGEGTEGPRITGKKLDFTLDFDRNVEWNLSETNRATRMGTSLRPEDAEHEIGKPVDDRRLADEAGR